MEIAVSQVGLAGPRKLVQVEAGIQVHALHYDGLAIANALQAAKRSYHACSHFAARQCHFIWASFREDKRASP